MKRQSPLETRLAKYGTMSLALAAVSAPQAANASVIAFTGQPAVNDSGGPIYFNLLTGQVDLSPVTGDYELFTEVKDSKTAARLQVVNATMLNSSSQRRFAVSSLGGSFSSFQSAARLKLGDTIGPGLPFAVASGTLASNSNHASLGSIAFGHFNSSGSDVGGYLGLEVLQGSTPQYGWANIVVHPDFSITLNSFALQTDGSPIDATPPAPPETPEPASILLLALGAAGMAAYRRKQKA